MEYITEDNRYYNNCNNYYDPNYNQNVAYEPTYYAPEYSLSPQLVPDIYQCNGITYANEQHFDRRFNQPIDARGYQIYSEDEMISSDFMNQRKINGMKNIYPTMISNGFTANGPSLSLYNEANGKGTYKSESSKRSYHTNSCNSSNYPKNNAMIIHINGKKACGVSQKVNTNYRKDDSVKSWTPISTNRDRLNEDYYSFINEPKKQDDSNPNDTGIYQQFETVGKNGRTTVISINCNNNNMKNKNKSKNKNNNNNNKNNKNNNNNNKNNNNNSDSDSNYDSNSDSNCDSDDDENENEDSKNQMKKPAKPKKIFMGKYLFSDIKKSLIYPITTCASQKAHMAVTPTGAYYTINPKARGEKNRKPEIVVRY